MRESDIASSEDLAVWIRENFIDAEESDFLVFATKRYEALSEAGIFTFFSIDGENWLFWAEGPEGGRRVHGLNRQHFIGKHDRVSFDFLAFCMLSKREVS